MSRSCSAFFRAPPEASLQAPGRPPAFARPPSTKLKVEETSLTHSPRFLCGGSHTHYRLSFLSHHRPSPASSFLKFDALSLSTLVFLAIGFILGQILCFLSHHHLFRSYLDLGLASRLILTHGLFRLVPIMQSHIARFYIVIIYRSP